MTRTTTRQLRSRRLGVATNTLATFLTLGASMLPASAGISSPTVAPRAVVFAKDLSVAISDNATLVAPGSRIITTVTVTNRSSTSVFYQIFYVVPSSHTLESVSLRNPIGPVQNFGTAGIPTSILNAWPGDSVFSVAATVKSTAIGTIASTVRISPLVEYDGGTFIDINALNNTATDTTLIGSPETTKAPTTTGAPTTPAPTATVAAPPTTIGAATQAPTSAPTTSAPTTSATTLSSTTSTPSPTVAPPSVDGFQSPTGTTKCLLVSNPVTGQAMRCTVIGSTAKLPKRPATCDFDWEDIAVNATGRSYTVCAGDTIDANYPILAYGQTWKRSVFTCTSAKSGITCRNPTKRGFRITKAKRTYL